VLPVDLPVGSVRAAGGSLSRWVADPLPTLVAVAGGVLVAAAVGAPPVVLVLLGVVAAGLSLSGST
jgi:hypothetical protein